LDLQLKTEGDPLDATPVSICVEKLQRALDSVGVVIVPGFYGIHPNGQVALLGRGGSDLTALFLANVLNAECRLLKDVHGWFDRDPRIPGFLPSRYELLSYEAAIDDAAPIVQAKAVQAAKAWRQSFQVASLHRDGGTTVGAGATELALSSRDPEPLRILLAGAGTVGRELCRQLQSLENHLQIVRVLIRDPAKQRSPFVPKALLTHDEGSFLSTEADLLVELTGDDALATRLHFAGVRRGLHLVTANKAALAEHLVSLKEEGARQGVEVLYSASVGGAVPMVEWAQALRSRGIRSLRCVLNGTTNEILEQLRRGGSLQGALAQSRKAGLCEANHERDLGGFDAFQKLRILATTITGTHNHCGGILETNIPRPFPRRKVLRQVATADFTQSPPKLCVRLEALNHDDPLYCLPGSSNALLIQTEDGRLHRITGAGAGGRPTSESVVQDLLRIVRIASKTRSEVSV
jgi:homoserine dehydrogenase